MTPRSGMHSWLQDPFQRDQFLIRYKDQVEVYWCDSPSPQLVHDGKSDLSCSQPPIEWSPLGTYVVTYHGQGIMLHSGSSFTECGRFPHKDVQRVLFKFLSGRKFHASALCGLRQRDFLHFQDKLWRHTKVLPLRMTQKIKKLSRYEACSSF